MWDRGNRAKAPGTVSPELMRKVLDTDIVGVVTVMSDPHGPLAALPPLAVRIAVHLATLGPDGPSGGFFNDDGPVPW